MALTEQPVEQLTEQPGTLRRARGRRANLDRSMIVQAARALSPDELTITSVAEALGVDRKAVSHHVGDRDALLELVAVEALSAHFAAAVIDESDWKTACRSYAMNLKDGLLATGYLAEHFRVGAQTGISALAPAGATLDSMVLAGFDEVTAARGVAIVTGLVITHVRNVVMSRRSGAHPQRTELHRILDDTSVQKFDLLRRLLVAEIDPADDASFDLGLDIFIYGMERVLERTPSIHSPRTES